jgi:4'-phosphopantetheinyl transferase
MILYTFQTEDIFNGENKKELLNRSLLDYCVNKNIAIPENGFDIIKTSNGKPEIANMNGIHFSISHTKDLFICGIQDTNLGIDVEDLSLKESLNLKHAGDKYISERYIAIAKRFYSKEENEYLEGNGFQNFFRIWVRKEAFIKAKGTGISEGLNKFSVIKNGEFIQTIEDMHLEELHFGKYIGFNKDQLLGAYCSRKLLVLEKHVNLNK